MRNSPTKYGLSIAPWWLLAGVLLAGVVQSAPVGAQTWQTWDGSLPGTPPTVELDTLASDENSTAFTVTLHGFYIDTLTVDAVLYHSITIPEPALDSIPGIPFDPATSPRLASDAEEGRPVLPQIARLVGVATDATSITLDSVTVTSYFFMDTFLGDSIRVIPQQAFTKDCSCCSDPGPFTIDQAFYDTSTTFGTDGSTGPIDIWMTLKVGRVQVNLTQYAPAQKALRVMQEARVRIGHFGGLLTGINAPRTEDELDLAFGQVVNFKKIKNLFVRITRRALLIIIRDDFAAEIEPLRLSKVAAGDTVIVVKAVTGVPTPPDIKGTDSTAVQTRIQSFFNDVKTNLIPAVLLVGDADRIAGKRWRDSDKTPEVFITDKPYALVAGGDHKPDLFIARMSVDSKPQLRNMLKKILRYQTNPLDGAWLKTVTLAATRDTASTAVDYMDNQCSVLNLVSAPALGNTVNFAPGRTLGAADACGPLAARGNTYVQGRLNAGTGILAYRGHGCPERWAVWSQLNQPTGDWDIGRVLTPTLTNGCANPVVFAICCYNGRFDPALGAPGGACTANPSDGIGEEWMQVGDKKGAVAHYGSSPGSFTGVNHDLNTNLFTAIYDTKIPTLAMVCMTSEMKNITKHDSPAFKGRPSTMGDDNCMAYQLFGDPLHKIRTSAVVAPPVKPPPVFKDATCLKTGKPCADQPRYDAAKATARLQFTFQNDTTAAMVTTQATGFAVDRLGRKDIVLTARANLEKTGHTFKSAKAEFGAEYGNGTNDCQSGGPACAPPAGNCAAIPIVSKTIYRDPTCDWGLLLLQANAPATIPLAATNGARNDVVFVPQYPTGRCKVVSEGAFTDSVPGPCSSRHTADVAAGSAGAPVILDMVGHADRYKVIGIQADTSTACIDSRSVKASALLRATGGGAALIDSVVAALDSTRTEVDSSAPNVTALLSAAEAADGNSVRIAYSIADQGAKVTIVVYDVSGRLVRTVEQLSRGPGAYTSVWDRRNDSGMRVAKGVYLVHMRTNTTSDTKKLLLLR